MAPPLRPREQSEVQHDCLPRDRPRTEPSRLRPPPTVTRRTPMPEIEPEPSGDAGPLPGRPVRDHPASRGPRRRPAGLEPGLARLARRGDRAGLLRDLRDGDQHGLPPLLHPLLVQGEPGTEDRAGHRGHPGHRGPGPGLGGRPPPAPQVQRQGRRPALAVAVRHRLEGADQGLRLRARRLALQPEPDVAGQVLPGPAGGQGRQPRLAVVPRPGRRVAARSRR